MAAIKEKIDEANEATDRAVSMKEEENKKVQELHLYLEDKNRHKQSLELRLAGCQKQLQDVTDKLKKAEMAEECHVNAMEDYERREEVHNARVNKLEQVINQEKSKLSENLMLLEEAKRAVDACKRKRDLFHRNCKEKERRITVLVKQLEDKDGLSSLIETNSMSSIAREYEMEKVLDGLQEKIGVAKNRVQVAERQIPSLQHRMDVTKQETNMVRHKAKVLSNELNSAIESMRDLDLE
eukprot:gene8807-9748_t